MMFRDRHRTRHHLDVMGRQRDCVPTVPFRPGMNEQVMLLPFLIPVMGLCSYFAAFAKGMR